LRDPVKASASVMDVSGTLYYMRSDNIRLNKKFGKSIDGNPAFKTFQNMIDWMENGTIPRDRIHPVAYLDFFADPDAALERLYSDMGSPLDRAAKASMLDYIASKPKGKFGSHDYDRGDEELIAEGRDQFRVFQEYFGVHSEI
jgi:hypothetical protein